MDLKGKNIIIEVIPTHSKREYGYIVQIQALKLDDYCLKGRFDYRVIDDLVKNKDLLNMISYDKDSFNYCENVETMINDFKKWSKGYKLLYLDNDYTYDYLKDFDNEKEKILTYFKLPYSNDCIDKLCDKYHLEASNNIVDLLYEALIYESNSQNNN